MKTLRTIAFALAAVGAGLLVIKPLGWKHECDPKEEESKTLLIRAEWRGQLSDGSVLTHADLRELLELHVCWLETDETYSPPTGFRRCTRSEDQLRTDQLIAYRATLVDAYMPEANLTRAGFDHANLTRARLTRANLSEADLESANLTGAQLGGSNLTAARLGSAKLTGAVLSGANLTRARLNLADLSYANLRETDLTNAQLKRANLECAIYEPKPDSLPYIPFLASAKNLDKLWYEKSEAGLVELRNALRQAGMRRQEREVNCALLTARRVKLGKPSSGFGDRVDAAFNYYFFEITCKYGLLPGRPLQILGVVVLVFAVPYFWVLRRPKRSSRSDIWLEFELESLRPNRNGKRRKRLLVSAGVVLSLRARIKRSWRILVAAVYFSLLTAFRVGFREINVGNWITRMQCREYTIRATGWIRFVTGVQSLISVALVALWLVTYFGRPFQ